MQFQDNDRDSDVRAGWIRFVLQTAKWIMLGIIIVSLINIFLNIMDIVFKLGWGYSWISLFVGCAFAILAGAIRRLAQWLLVRG